MVFTAHQARTTLVIAVAGAALATSFVLMQRHRASCATVDETSPYIQARLASSQIQRGALEQDIAVTIQMPGNGETAAPPLSLAVVIDRSGSMNGTPLQNAKRAAAQLVDQLRPEDAFTVVTYSSSDETVFAMARATPANKAAAKQALDGIVDDGGTCISCGLTRGVSELDRSPITRGMRHMVLLSDGQANEGLWDRDELAQLASSTALRGTSISTVGVGLDFDELTMIRLSQVGHGQYYFVEDTANLDAMFHREMHALSQTVATEVSLAVTLAPGVSIDRAYGYPMSGEQEGLANGELVIPIANLRSGESRKIVLHAQVPAGQSGGLAVGRFELRWHAPGTNEVHQAETTLSTVVTDDAGAVLGSTDHATVETITEARTAAALEDATLVYERYGRAGAQKHLQRHVDQLREAGTLTPKIERAAHEAMDSFDNGTSDKVRKVVRTGAYELVR